MMILAKKYDLAEKQASAILEQDPQNILAREVKTQTLFISGNRDQAITIMEDLLKGPKPSEDMFINTAQMYMVTGRTEDALALAMKGTALFPKSPRIRFLASDIYVFKKDMPNAKKWVEDAYRVSGSVSTGVAVAMFYARHGMEDLYKAQIDDLKKRFPKESEPYLLESSIMHQRKDLEGSLKAAQKALELKDTTQTRSIIAQLLIEKKDLPAAKTLLNETNEKDKKAVYPRVLLARIYLEEKNSDKALELLEMPLKTSPGNPEIASAAAQAYLMKGELKKAREIAESALDENKQNIMLHRIMAKIHYTQNEFKEAVEETDLLVKNSIKTPDILYIGAISSLKTGNIQAADTYVQLLRAAVPNDWVTYHSSILLSIAKKDIKGAYQTADRAIDLFPDNEDGLILYTYLAPKATGWQNAIAKISGICTKKNTAACHMTLSFLHEGAGNNGNALQEIKKAIEIEPGKITLYHALAQYYARHNMVKDAQSEYQKILNKKPDDLAAATMLAMLYQSSGDNGSAKKVYRYILEKNTKDARAANNLAWILAEENDKKDLDEAMMLAQKAKDAFPEDPRIADTLGYVYLRKGLADNALGQFQLAVEKLPNEPTILYHQALAFVDLKRPKDAAQALSKSLGTNQNFKEKQEAQALLSKIQSGKN